MKRPWTGSPGFPDYKLSPPLCSEHVADKKGGYCDEGRHGQTDEGFRACHACHQTPCTYNSKTRECLNLIHAYNNNVIGKQFLGSKSSHTTF